MPTKAEITRQTILEAALTLIQKEGYEKANMRAIAESAGLSLGAAYYYFPGKDHIIQAYYEDNFARYLPLAEEIIEQGKDFAATYTEVLAALYRTAAPWHKVATPLFSAAAVPGSPLSPFSDPSAPLRQRAIGLFARLLEKTPLKTAPLLEPYLPLLLWLFHILTTTFWVFDRSQDQQRTYKFIAAATPLFARLLSFTRLAPLRPTLRAGLKLFSFFGLPEIPNVAEEDGGDP